MTASELTEYCIYDYAHFFTGLAAASWGFILGGQAGAAGALILVVLLAAWKEFWWDIRYEPPQLSGGYLGGLRDFSGYLGGAAFALLLLFLKSYL